MVIGRATRYKPKVGSRVRALAALALAEALQAALSIGDLVFAGDRHSERAAAAERAMNSPCVGMCSAMLR
ncbi:MAG TPA: hypothetical protein VF718_13380 [Allosphingosinicella sp.]